MAHKRIKSDVSHLAYIKSKENIMKERVKEVNFLVVGLSVLFLLSCSGKRDAENEKKSYTYELHQTGNIKSFPLDAETRYNAFYLYAFEDKGKAYLSFLNYRTNQILFYDLNTCKFLFKTELDKEGPNGIGLASGYYIQDFNHIYVSSYAYSGLMKVDTSKQIVQKIPYKKTTQGYNIVPSYAPSSHPYDAPVQIGNRIYITQSAANHIYPSEKTPVSVSIDTVSWEYDSLPFTYGDALSEAQLAAPETYCSRIFDGKNFIYSFCVEPDIFVASIDHKQIQRIDVKSQYIRDIPLDRYPDDMDKGARMNLEVARYGDLIYDKYRNVYYRFAYPSTSLDMDTKWIGKSVYGRKKCSIIILDKEFNIIGETLLPEGVYNSYVFFIDKAGLYISKDYQMNYDQSEDFMTFELFELTKSAKS